VVTAQVHLALAPLENAGQRPTFANLISMFIIVATAAGSHRAPLDSGASRPALRGSPAVRLAIVRRGLLGRLLSRRGGRSPVPPRGHEPSARTIVGKKFREAKLFLDLLTGQVVIGRRGSPDPGNLIQLLVQAQVSTE